MLQSIKILNILTSQKRDMTEQKLIWPVNMTGQYSKIILSPACKKQTFYVFVFMTTYFNFAANIIIAGHTVTLVVDSRITTYEVFIPVKANLIE